MSSTLWMRCARVAADAAIEAGGLLAKHMGEPASVETKRSPIDLVTEIDRASELLLVRRLEKAFPAFGFLGEEHGQRRADAAFRWIIDPLDGTMNFVHGVPLFGVSIGLEQEGRLVVGLIYDPCRKELYVAVRGRGATLNRRPLRVSRTRRMAQGLLATGFASTFRTTPEPYLTWFKRLESESHAVRRLGTTALALAYIASGRLEGFYERHLKPWDMAGGIVLVEEAGGRVSDLQGQPIEMERGDMIASNGRIHDEIVAAIRRRVR